MKIISLKRTGAVGMALLMCLSLFTFAMSAQALAAPGWGGGPGRPGAGLGPGECPAVSEEEALAALVESFPLPEDEDELFSRRDFNTDCAGAIQIDLGAAEAEGRGWKLSDGKLSISTEGNYLLFGSLEGSIYISCSEEEKVQLALNNASVTNPRGAAVHVASADKVFITTVAGSENFLIASGDYSGESDEDANGAVFARCDLSFNGKGSLWVKSAQGHGIVTKDDIKICSGMLNVESAKRALSGKDSVRIAGGEISLVSGGDAIRSEHDKENKGFVYIKGGLISIESRSDGIQCSGGCFIRGGEISIITGGGSAAAPAADSAGNGADSESQKGIKSTSHIGISGGELALDTVGDALHSEGSVIISEGEISLSTGDDGVHAGGSLLISGGKLNIARSFEGLEAELAVLRGGSISITADDDGINAAGGNDGSGFGGRRGGDAFLGGNSSAVSISGGRLYISAVGDGIDSNGAVYVSGGETVIEGPVSGMDSIVDCGSPSVISGGSFVGTSALGMNMNFCAGSAQGSFCTAFSKTMPAGEKLSVLDGEGKELISLTPGKEYQAVLISLPGMALGESYSVCAGDESLEVLLDESIYTTGPGFGGGLVAPGAPGGRGGMVPPGGFGGGWREPPEGFEPPEKPQ